MNVVELRQEYMRAGLSEADADRDPVRQFEHWLEDALRARLPLPNAATLATVSAWASAQSGAVPDRAAVEAAMEEARQRHGERPPRPPHWGGYRVTPQSVEFWQGRADRLHDRLLYTRGGGGGWRIERLAP